MLLKSKQDAEEFVFWCVTLQCEVLPQGIGRLQSSIGYCCLGCGVACTIPEHEVTKNDEGQLLYALPDTEQNCPEWLVKVSGDVEKKTGRNLIERNDTLRQSHKEIGTLLLELYRDELNYWFSGSPENDM